MYAIEYGNDIFLIDCGNKFPDETLLGIDLIVPDITYLLENKERVRALLVTHGHEDHIGGIPYLLKQINVPVYATRFTLGLIELKLQEHKILREAELHEINSMTNLSFGQIKVSFFKVTHSIPDCLGIVIRTPEGNIVHTGDFKFDLTPANDEAAEIHKMAAIGEGGVLVLLSESTNAERPGATPSEQIVGEHVLEAIMKAERKIFLSTFASNVNRIQQVVDASIKANRKLALIGRSMINVVDVAIKRGYLTIPDGMLIDQEEINNADPEKVTILCTGSQGEPMAALARLSTGNYRGVDVLPGDTVILAAGPIPGNEINVTRIVDNLYSLGANVIYSSGKSTAMHVSGHGYQEDLKLLLTLMKPQYFIPIHGELRMLHQHRILAESVGVKEGHTFILNNGEVVDINRGDARQTRKVHAGNTYVDGIGIGDVGDVVLRDRKQLSEDGMLVTILTMSKTKKKLIGTPDTISRGFVYMRESEELLEKIDQVISRTMKEFEKSNKLNWGDVKRQIKKAVGQFVFNETKKKPMILPIIIEV
ncbi:ribonuclease J [Aquibacillus salsiterrae]|uniref:Ribonuclease J n=1 Tax=Aquibacillus salsiterrae TaxID=2950439 RepID=A0A9X3WCN6_9BACI|nr:ribonuclease J [Aquibacillus salsiterrae]